MEAITVSVYRTVLRARDEVHLPPEKGTMLRGGFGVALKRTACAFHNPAAHDCTACPLRSTCAYPRLFEGVPPGITRPIDRDVPRPFVFRIPQDRRTHYHEGDALAVEFALVGWARDYLPYVAVALADLAEGGLGRERGRFELREIWSLDPYGRSPIRLDEGPEEAPPHIVDWSAVAQRAATLPPDGVTVAFLTPTRLVSDHHPVSLPSFYRLTATLRRRAEAMSRFHCGTVWAPDHEMLASAAEGVQLVRESATWRERSRRSTRSTGLMPMSGLTGRVRYEGDLRSFRALLALGEVFHVGKYAAFGNGQMRCSAVW